MILPFAHAVTAVLVLLKMIGYITLDWLTVLSPSLIVIAFVFVCGAIVAARKEFK
jgi:hypothetical protein